MSTITEKKLIRIFHFCLYSLFIFSESEQKTQYISKKIWRDLRWIDEMMFNSKKCVFFLFECVTDRRHKRLHATTYFGKLFATLCNRTELNHIHALDIGDGSCNFFPFNNGFRSSLCLCSAWENPALCGWCSPPTDENKKQTLQSKFRYVFYWWLLKSLVIVSAQKLEFPFIQHSDIDFPMFRWVLSVGNAEKWRSNAVTNVRSLWLLRLATSNTSLGTRFNSTSNCAVVPHIKRQSIALHYRKGKRKSGTPKNQKRKEEPTSLRCEVTGLRALTSKQLKDEWLC